MSLYGTKPSQFIATDWLDTDLTKLKWATPDQKLAIIAARVARINATPRPAQGEPFNNNPNMLPVERESSFTTTRAFQPSTSDLERTPEDRAASVKAHPRQEYWPQQPQAGRRPAAGVSPSVPE